MAAIRFRMRKRAGSSVPPFKVRLPKAVAIRWRGKRILFHMSEREGPPFAKIAKVGVAHIEFSLGTKDVRLAASREAEAQEHCRRLVELTESEPIQLSNSDMVAYSGDVYRLYERFNYQDPGETLAWRYHKALHRAVIEGRIAGAPVAALIPSDTELQTAIELFGKGDLTEAVNKYPPGQFDNLEDRFGLLTDWLLIRHRLNLTAKDRKILLMKVATASLDAGWQVRRYTEDNYSEDDKARRFPPIKSVISRRPTFTITGLLGLWWKEKQSENPSAKTYRNYKGTIDRLVKFLGHDDADRVTDDHLLKFKDFRLNTVSNKTFRDGDMPALNSVFGWAAKNKKIENDPTRVAGLKLKRSRRVVARERGFTDKEAVAIFERCLSYEKPKRELDKTAAAKRWSLLIQCYTGTRIEEVLQLRKADVIEVNGYKVFRFTPDAGEIKNKRYRDVPVHQHLIDLGFLSFVESAEDGRLFGKCYTSVRIFARTIVSDKDVQPTHAWRHRFKSISRTRRWDTRVVKEIQGHDTGDSSEEYGDVDLKMKARVIQEFPWVKCAPQSVCD
jgi:integrase